MNPPFTRIERLEDNYKDYLTGNTGIFREFDRYFKGQSGLHCFFLVHVKHFLRDGGRFGAVLPAATFSSEYGEKLKPFILENYRILFLFTYQSQSTFSVGCDFKEILLVGVKGRKEAQSSWKAKVIVLKKELERNQVESLANQIQTIETEVDAQRYSVRIVPKHDFKNERNWMVFTRPKSLQEFVRKLRESKATASQNDVIQFHEGYHLDAAYFFRLPNEYWDIEQDGEIFITISEKATKRKLNISKQYLKDSLDVPDNQRIISAKMNNYILSISESEPEDRIPQNVQEYIEWGRTFKKSDESKTVLDLFKILYYTRTGRRWYTYGSHILGEKVPIGSHMAIVEKFRTKQRECIAFYSTNLLTGSNSYFFGIVQSAQGLLAENPDKSSNRSLETEQILAAWFSSTLFLALYQYYRREISGDYGRIKIGDMASFPCIDPSLVSESNRKYILTEFEHLMRKELPTIYDQLKTKKLQKLDEAILRAIGIEDFGMLLDNLYTDLLQELDKSEINAD